MGEPNRLRLLLACLDKPQSVGDLAGQLELSIPLVSQHLRLLRSVWLLYSKREGKHGFYEINDELTWSSNLLHILPQNEHSF
ncbi:TPA: ArsR/SmtB family transcription factor [Legionella pneumophila]|nr:metalloregulator ArsR/SmtB family transcription factor [Legionella pneumophila]HAU2406555.1 winged helix-turn-helix transcriptional regulator [Legionella pneumophila]